MSLRRSERQKLCNDSLGYDLKLCERILSFAVSLREEGEVALLESPNGLGATVVSAYAEKGIPG